MEAREIFWISSWEIGRWVFPLARPLHSLYRHYVQGLPCCHRTPCSGIPSMESNGKQGRSTSAFRHPLIPSFPNIPSSLVSRTNIGEGTPGLACPTASCLSWFTPSLFLPPPNHSSCPHPLTTWKGILFRATSHLGFYSLYVTGSFFTALASHLSLKASRDGRKINLHLRAANSVKI